MAKTYYGYKERDTKNRFNWADVGVKISDAIETEAKDRERRKAEEEQAVRDIVKSAGESIPSTADASLNNQILQTTNTQINSLMDAYRDFKSGKGRQNEWVQRRQNMGDNIENYLGLMTDYATMYDKKITRQKEDTSLGWEAESMSQIQDFNDYTKWRVVNNEHDQAFYQRVGPDGELLEGDENKISLAIARKQTTMYYDKYDTNAGVKKGVDMFGVTLLAIQRDGALTRQDIRLRDDANKRLREVSKSQLTNSFDRLSILEKDIGANINYVYSQDDVKGTGINEDGSYNVYMKEDPITKIKQPAFTTEQEDAIYTRFEDMILNASDIKETPLIEKAPTRPTVSDAQIKRGDQKRSDNANLKYLDIFLTGSPAEKESVRPFLTTNPTFNKIVWDENGNFSTTDKNDRKSNRMMLPSINKTNLESTIVSLAKEFGISESNALKYYNKNMTKKNIVLPKGKYEVDRGKVGGEQKRKIAEAEQAKKEWDSTGEGKALLVELNKIKAKLDEESDIDSQSYADLNLKFKAKIGEYNEGLRDILQDKLKYDVDGQFIDSLPSNERMFEDLDIKKNLKTTPISPGRK
jgi:hypothetical protein